MRIKIYMGTHICIDMCENICIIKQNNVVEIQKNKNKGKNDRRYGSMYVCISTWYEYIKKYKYIQLVSIGKMAYT